MANSVLLQENKSLSCRIGAIASILTFFLIPFVFSVKLIDPVQIPQMVVLATLCGISCLSFTLSKVKSDISFNLADMAFLLLIVFTILSLIYTRDVSAGIFETGKLITFYLLFKIFQYYLKNKQVEAIITMVIAIQCIIQGLLAIGQKYFGLKMYGGEIGFLGTMTHPNVFSECMIFSFPFVVIALIRSKWPLRIVPVVSIALITLMVVVAKTRSVWVGCGFSLLAMLIVVIRNKSSGFIVNKVTRNSRIILLTSGAVVSVLAIFVILDWQDITKHVLSLFSLESSSRFAIWKKTLNIIKDHFWFGVGPGNWCLYIPVTFQTAIQRPHNDFLWVLSENGIFAFVSYVSIFVFAVITLLKRIRLQNGTDLVTSLALLFGIIVYIVDSNFAFPKERPYSLMLLALMLALIFGNENKAIIKINRKLFGTITVIVCLASGYFYYQRMYAEELTKKVMEGSNLQSLEKIGLLNRINPVYYSVNSFSSPIKFIEGNFWIEAGDFKNAIRCFNEAYQVTPLNPELLINMGALSENISERQNAIRYFREAVTIDPYNSRALLNLAVVLYKDDDKTGAAKIVQRIDTNTFNGQAELITQYAILKSSLGLN
jgi:O-antigen ligase